MPDNPTADPQQLTVPDHYPYVTRSLLALYESDRLPNVRDIIVEPEYGYVTNIQYVDGSHRVTHGNDLGLNSGAAADTVSDKGHTKFFLRKWGIACPEGDEFLTAWWAQTIAAGRLSHSNVEMRTTERAAGYINDKIGYPVYVKPVDGSKGGGIHKVYDESHLQSVLADYEERRIRVAMVESPVNMPDYRVVTLDGELISAYRRVPLSVTGDGERTIHSLLAAKQQLYYEQGRDTRIDLEDERIARYLSHKGLDLQTVPTHGDEVIVAAISNLSAGGTSEDITGIIHERWVELASRVAGSFSLRLCGLDLACEDITSPDSDYSVIEVNAAPGLDHYASSGDQQREIVDALYARVFNAMPSDGYPGR